MAKAKIVSLHDHLFFDRLLLSTLILAAGGYVFQGGIIGVVLEVGALFGGVIWTYRTATGYPKRGVRLAAATLFSILALFMIIFIAGNQGIVSNDVLDFFSSR